VCVYECEGATRLIHSFIHSLINVSHTSSPLILQDSVFCAGDTATDGQWVVARWSAFPVFVEREWCFVGGGGGGPWFFVCLWAGKGG
jgi:hypothetical protein